ncbi:sigma-70 family RNA polymerase sigma factor [Paludisphaera rhizosphaerae]|uniref:sigma-70 family RNA polymerase sigma factor n=1 Tax=Paludisphaera rhizosphaerae TaxID=2711216 RepID=UPI0013EBA62C|nr:sigma-70 family RNA polymerase sigma factor [Paludisphaera rhizosphaerae]
MLTSTEIDEVIDQVLRGHRDAFRFIVRSYSLPIRAYIASRLRRADDVDDLTQEVFIAAFRDLAQYHPGGDFGAWVRGIARHKLNDYFRSTTRRTQAHERFRLDLASSVETELDAAATCEPSDSIEALLRCISRLPEKLRRVVKSGLDGDKPASLAEELATTVGAVYNLHYRANQVLRDCVKKELS